ncbi:hypothetical protein NEF87_002475 [Candidatus Lokiarchaeum ossiferum]|uniref:ABC transmembrane type-1 domain-containing protein n=1 Tax=Candidatus Lokiarchaeum ossiferum TaxID=2951803 RepID=A0ABY6HS04_9ARCH|nr:hypothetical protein NEF87_002475 [Candidatus Lokiarchaeum sp. B-35]
MTENFTHNEHDKENTPILIFLKKIRPTRKNFGWWFLTLILLIIIYGIIRSWIIPSAMYFDPFISIFELFLKIFGFSSLGDLDWRLPAITRRLAAALPLTIFISLISVVIGFFIAALLAVILVSKSKLYGLRQIAQIYIDFFRSTPLLVQILLVYFGLPGWMIDGIRNLNIQYLTTEIYAGTLALALNTAAYQAEIIRGGILAIPSGQSEAARGLGLTSLQTMRHVVLPQAIRIIVPPLTNETINVILNSSLISTIGVIELTKESQTLQSRYAFWQVFIFAAVFYFAIAFTLSKIAKQLELKLRIPGLGVHND